MRLPRRVGMQYALELLLTGETYRFENRSKVWREGWRNLHHKTARVTAEFALEGEKGPCTVAREWADGAELDAATAWAQVHGKPRGAKEALGWETPLQNLRPFLSYNELGSLLVRSGMTEISEPLVRWLWQTYDDACTTARAEDLRREVFEEGLGASVAWVSVPEFRGDVHDLKTLAEVARILCPDPQGS